MISLALVVAILSSGSIQKKERFTGLKEDLTKMFASVQGEFALACEDLQSEERLLINERIMFHAASTMKTPVMAELFLQSSRGKIRLGDTITIKNEFKSIADGSSYSLKPLDDNDQELYGKIGFRVTMRDLIARMITKSSNLATNILIEYVGAANVTATMRRIGADSIQVLRGVEDQKAYDLGMNNRTTALDLLVLFRALARNEIANPESCREMITILEGQEFHDEIPALLPKGTRVAHKTGSISGVQHDSGVVFLKDGRSYVLVLLSGGLKEKSEGKRVLAKASKMIYDRMMEQR